MLGRDTALQGSACKEASTGKGEDMPTHSGREEKKGRREQEKRRGEGEEEKGERGRERFSHCRASKASEALDPDPQTQVWPRCPHSLVPPLQQCHGNLGYNCIRADYL